MSKERLIGTSFTIPERISTGVIEALMKNYKDPQQAFTELVDNAVDNRIKGKPLSIRIRVSKNELSILNQGGKGLDENGLRGYFDWGDPSRAGEEGTIGQYRVGGKGAAGYLARDLGIVCSAPDSEIEYRVFEPNWESRMGGKTKEPTVEVRRSRTDEGYFQLKLTGVKREVNAEALTAKLGDIYRPLLSDNSVKIFVNGKEVLPLEIKYLRDNPAVTPAKYIVPLYIGHEVEVTAGALAEEQNISPGIRCYYRGRLVEDEEYFGYPKSTPGISRLIGETHLDFVPVTANKSNFDKGSFEWKYAQEGIHNALSKLINGLSSLPSEQRPIDIADRMALNRVTRDLENILSRTGLITRRDLLGSDYGRRPPGPSIEPPKPPTGKTRTPGEVKGATYPTSDATVGGEKVRRLGIFHGREIVPMDPRIRAEVEGEEGMLILRINNEYPLYQAAKRAGDSAVELYLAETVAMKACEHITRSQLVPEYLTLLNQVLAEYGRFVRSKMREPRR